MTNTKIKARYTYQPKQSTYNWQMTLLSPRIVICYPNDDPTDNKATVRIGCESVEEAHTLGKALVSKGFISRYETTSMKRDKLQEFVLNPRGVAGLRKGAIDVKGWDYNYSVIQALANKDWVRLFEPGIKLKFSYTPDYAMCIINQWIGVWLEKDDARYLQENWESFNQEDKVNLLLTWEVLPQSMLGYLGKQLPQVEKIPVGISSNTSTNNNDDCEF